MTKELLRFPIVLKTHEDAGPPQSASGRSASLYYEVAANGVFQVRDARTHRAVTQVEREIPGLCRGAESIELRFPPLPRNLTERVLAFFYEVHSRWDGEAIVILFYDAETGRFDVGVPPQTIRAYTDYYGRTYTDHHLEYGQVARPAGHVRLGTIHSHGTLDAAASHTDCEDERYGDGLHIVFGRLTSMPISISAAFVANGVRFRLHPDDVLEPTAVPAWDPPADWLTQVEYVPARSGGAKTTTAHGGGNGFAADDRYGYGGSYYGGSYYGASVSGGSHGDSPGRYERARSGSDGSRSIEIEVVRDHGDEEDEREQ